MFVYSLLDAPFLSILTEPKARYSAKSFRIRFEI